MSTIKVDTIATRTGSGNITLSNNVASLTSAGAISGTNLSASGTLAVTGASTLSGGVSGTLTVANGVTLTDGNLVVASGHGIDFSAAGNAGNTTSELFDDYEEGFIAAPVVKVGGTVCTLASTSGLWYAKIGRTVIGSVEFRISNYNGGSDETTVDLPFTSVSGNYTTGALRVYNGSVSGREFSTIQSAEALLKFNINNDGGATTNYTPAINAYIYTSFAYTAA